MSVAHPTPVASNTCAGRNIAPMVAMTAAIIPACPRLKYLIGAVLCGPPSAVITAKNTVNKSTQMSILTNEATIDPSERPRNERLPMDNIFLQILLNIPESAATNGIENNDSNTHHFLCIVQRINQRLIKFSKIFLKKIKEKKGDDLIFPLQELTRF